MFVYVGKGFIPGIPARNISDDEATIYGKKRLLASGLYKYQKDKKPDKQAKEQPCQA